MIWTAEVTLSRLIILVICSLLSACKVVAFPNTLSAAEQCYQDAQNAQNKGANWFITATSCGEPFFHHVKEFYSGEAVSYCLPRHDAAGKPLSAEDLTVVVALKTSAFLRDEMQKLESGKLDTRNGFGSEFGKAAKHYLATVYPCKNTSGEQQ